ncbi:MAG TPA: hypothetical protein VKV19_19870 [Ktedonobacteraceae bacterium]|nr:hypothetical protein [Ktedonobacteraceae bacterium]
MLQADFSCTIYAEICAPLDILNIGDASELVERVVRGAHPGRVPVIPLTSFMSFWDRFRRRRKDEEQSEGEEPKKQRRGWFHGGHVAGGIGSSQPAGSNPHKHHGGWRGFHHGHGGIGATGRGVGGGIGG